MAVLSICGGFCKGGADGFGGKGGFGNLFCCIDVFISGDFIKS
jgi:hypothetical protein